MLNPYGIGWRALQINNYQLFIINYQLIGDRIFGSGLRGRSRFQYQLFIINY